MVWAACKKLLADDYCWQINTSYLFWIIHGSTLACIIVSTYTKIYLQLYFHHKIFSKNCQIIINSEMLSSSDCENYSRVDCYIINMWEMKCRIV